MLFEFSEYIAKHTLLTYHEARSLYAFSKAINLTKEEIVEKCGNPEELKTLFIARDIYKSIKT